MAVHFPADYELFSLVCIDCHNAGSKIDKGIKRIVNDKLQKTSAHWPEFVATSEDPKTIRVMLDLEQMIGREIIWLRGMGWEQMIRIKRALPNISWRFCTGILKIQPIFEYLYLFHELPTAMRIGYRYDESERKDSITTGFKFPYVNELRAKSNTRINRHKTIEWRVPEFPLIDNKVFHHQVRDFWKDKGIDFPLDSNCQNCFWKDPQQIRKNFETNPEIMYWAIIWEDLTNATFKSELSLLEASRLGIQTNFNFGTGSGCQAGHCTD